MNYNRAVMKLEVKQAMRQTRPHPMLVTLLYLVIVGFGTWLINWLMTTLFSGGGMSLQDLFIRIMMDGGDFDDIMYYYSPQFFLQMMIRAGFVSFLVSILTTAWNGLMTVGYSGYCLDMSRGMNPQLEQVFSGFPRAGSVILSYILVAIFTFLWSMLFGVGLGVLMGIAFVLADMAEALALLLIFAAPILYAVALIWVEYRYVMVPYAIVDSQNPMSAMDAIRTSTTIMKGRKGSFFVLRISFIGWYLLEALVVIVGFIIAGASIAGSINGMMHYGYSSGIGMVALLPVILLCGAGIFAINLWLTPYRTGCDARFYVYATGGNQPIQPGPYGGQSGPYGGPSGPYGGQSGPYGGQSGPYGGQSGPYGGQSGPYGGQSGQYRSQPGPYGGQPGPYNNNPYSYNPPSQSSFGGYAQRPQPPQYGAGTYAQGPQPPQYGAGTYTQAEQPLQYGGGVGTPQWGAPQAPQAPVYAAPAAPAEPAAPEAPVVPEAPVFPETARASVFDQTPAAPAAPADDVPAESADALYEAPYAEPETPGDDDTLQQPIGPSYPQY